ncbi:hypothetical protein DFR47_11320 [Pseudochrobactrum asaccharolyticum]|uniref:Helix-turn-helix protein n=2 Tax=Pseudochrobactrum asaccharolyticum TaxID=354351 RepID=A0A366DLU6_9HYPH|nr:hypothetical protein DFR47_11320 [Pseudochrobactrum asaccharolyticum]
MEINSDRTDTALPKLTGNQVRFIRTILGESQAKFAKRFAISAASVFRIEAKGDDEMTSPEIILIHQLAVRYNIAIPERLPRSGESATPAP